MENNPTEVKKVPTLEDVPKHGDLIYDVGLHKGEDTDFYLRKGFRVIAFEADPDLAQLCRERFKNFVDSGRLIIVEGAIFDQGSLGRKKTIKFFRNKKNSVLGTICVEVAGRNAGLGGEFEAIEVEIIDFVAALRKYGIPHYLKIDIEGADIACIDALKQFRERPDFLSMESSFCDFSVVQYEITKLRELGYDSFQAIDQSAIPRQIAPKPPCEGQYVAQQFKEGCAGLFGLELGAEWQTEQAIIHRYRRICLAIQAMGKTKKWKFRGSNRLRNVTAKFLTLLTNSNPRGWYDTHARYRGAISGP